MNSLDVVILIIVLISALIALNRGLIKEVLSIIGWFLGVVAVIYLLPYVQPLMEEHVESEIMAIVASAFAVFDRVLCHLDLPDLDNYRQGARQQTERHGSRFRAVFRPAESLFAGYPAQHTDRLDYPAGKPAGYV